MNAVPDFPGPGQLYRLVGTGAPVLLTHGTFSDADTCLPLAQFLKAAGYDVYVIEWRGRDGAPGAFDFYDLARGEIAAALRAMPAPSHMIAHSGGGLAMCFAMLDPVNRAQTRSLTMLGTQATHLKDAAKHRYLGIRALAWWGKRRGYWSARALRLGPCNESAALLGQWTRFNRARRITSADGMDLFPQLPVLNLPVLALAGAADTVIARPDGCRALAHAFGPIAQFHLCAAATDGEDFTHSRLFRSRAAAAHVWPRIIRFWDAV